MITGTSIQLVRPAVVGYDRLGNAIRSNPVPDPVPETVGNVLIVPGSTADLEASRPEGVTVAYTLHFPKTFTGSLEGCEVILPEPWSGTYNVIGNPTPYMDANTPTKWHMPVEVEAAHG